MSSWLSWMATQGFLPHGYCLQWQEGLVGPMVGSDIAIALSYYSIPAALVVLFHRKKGLQFGDLLAPESQARLREQLETNVLGVHRMARAFAPVLAANGGGAMLNVASVASWITAPALAGYAVTKSATWSLSNGLRNALRGQQTQVLTLHMAFVDTDMAQGVQMPKSSPQDIVARAFDALEAGAEEVLADEMTQQVKRGLSAEPGVYLQARS